MQIKLFLLIAFYFERWKSVVLEFNVHFVIDGFGLVLSSWLFDAWKYLLINITSDFPLLFFSEGKKKEDGGEFEH